MAEGFGDGSLAFAAWDTPFSDLVVWLGDVGYEAREGALGFRVEVPAGGSVYRVAFDNVSAFRVLDEHGLLELWQGQRPARTAFRVRNHAWTRESPVTFLGSDGWSFVVATDDTCIEIVSASEPEIVRER